MLDSIFHGILVYKSASKEEKRIQEGKIKNNNLPADIKQEVEKLKQAATNGNTAAMYKLGRMYLDGDKIGYSPADALKYLQMGLSKNDFNCCYTMAFFYRAEKSYQHLDACKCYQCYLAAKKCQTDDPELMNDVLDALANDFIIKELDNGELFFDFKCKIPII